MFTTTTNTALILRRFGAPLAVAALALTACGGSDDADGGGSGDGNEGNTASESDADSGDSSGDDVTGSGSNDEAQEALDDVGVDLDLDALEETVNNFSTGEGGGVVTIDGTPYTFAASVCIAQGEAFIAAGPGESPDGTVAWVSVDYANDYDFDGDGQNEETVSVDVEVGRTEQFGSGPDDQPRWSAASFDLTDEVAGGLSADFAGETISGAGPMNDHNFVALEFDETADMTFEASCT